MRKVIAFLVFLLFLNISFSQALIRKAGGLRIEPLFLAKFLMAAGIWICSLVVIYEGVARFFEAYGKNRENFKLPIGAVTFFLATSIIIYIWTFIESIESKILSVVFTLIFFLIFIFLAIASRVEKEKYEKWITYLFALILFVVWAIFGFLDVIRVLEIFIPEIKGVEQFYLGFMLEKEIGRGIFMLGLLFIAVLYTILVLLADWKIGKALLPFITGAFTISLLIHWNPIGAMIIGFVVFLLSFYLLFRKREGGGPGGNP